VEAASAGDSAARERLERVAEVLVGDRCHSFEDCISWARRLFEVPTTATSAGIVLV